MIYCPRDSWRFFYRGDACPMASSSTPPWRGDCHHRRVLRAIFTLHSAMSLHLLIKPKPFPPSFTQQIVTFKIIRSFHIKFYLGLAVSGTEQLYMMRPRDEIIDTQSSWPSWQPYSTACGYWNAYNQQPVNQSIWDIPAGISNHLGRTHFEPWRCVHQTPVATSNQPCHGQSSTENWVSKIHFRSLTEAIC